MNIIKKIFISTATIVSAAGIIISFFVMYPRRYDDNLYIQNISGDPSVLDAIKITGVLSDGVQKTDFVYQNSSFNKKYNTVTDDSISSYFFNKEYPPDLPNIRVVTKKAANQANLVIDICNGLGVSVTTDVIIRSDDYRIYQYGDIIHYKLSTGIDMGIGTETDFTPIEIVGDKMYLYTTTRADCAGFGGVYEIKVVNKKWTVSQKNLAPLDLKDGATQIVGMKASKDWFVFITVENSQVILKPFNRSSNTVENDIIVGPLLGNATTERGTYRHSIISELFYNAAIQDNSVFNIEIIDKYEYDVCPKSQFFSADLNENEVLLSYQESNPFHNGSKGEYRFDPKFSETVMKYKNNTLYVLRLYKQRLYTIGRDADTISVNSVHISVYENNRDVYQGELISAAEEDYKYQGAEMYKVLGKTYMRNYYYLGID